MGRIFPELTIEKLVLFRVICLWEIDQIMIKREQNYRNQLINGKVQFGAGTNARKLLLIGQSPESRLKSRPYSSNCPSRIVEEFFAFLQKPDAGNYYLSAGGNCRVSRAGGREVLRGNDRWQFFAVDFLLNFLSKNFQNPATIVTTSCCFSPSGGCVK